MLAASRAPGAFDEAGSSGENRLVIEEAHQIAGELARRGIAAFGGFLQTLQTDRLQIAGNIATHFPWPRRFGLEDLLNELFAIAYEGALPAKHFVQDHPQRVDIGPPICAPGISASLLGRHISRGAE
jgi:hypothetical protein